MVVGVVKPVKEKKVSLSPRLPVKPETEPMPGSAISRMNLPLRSLTRTTLRASFRYSTIRRSPTTWAAFRVSPDSATISFQLASAG